MADDEHGRVIPDEERARQILEQLKSVHTFDLAYETMVGLVNFGSQKMGLLEETREVRDLADARLSIELIRAILEVIEREQGPERTRGLHDALAQMQLAYAHAVQLDSAETGRRAGEGAADAGEKPAEAGRGSRPRPRTRRREESEPAAEKPAAKEAGREEAGARRSRRRRSRPTKKKPAPKKKPAGGS